jgi:Zn-dependent protease with chaperone function
MNATASAITRGALLALLIALICSPARGQCGWQQQIVNAVRNRLPEEKACSVLTAPPQPMFGTLDAIEADVLGSKSAVAPYDHEYWRYQEWLSSYARRFGALAGNAENQRPEQKVLVVRDKVPDAFATGSNVVLTTGLVDWFSQPQLALENMGLTV